MVVLAKREQFSPLKLKASAPRACLKPARSCRTRRPIATAVLAGSKSLDEAYNEVQIATGKINNDTIRLRKLRDFSTLCYDGNENWHRADADW
jgi:hypothetical protein